MQRKIPFLNLSKLYETYREDVLHAMNQVLDRAHYISGPCLDEFEKTFAHWVLPGSYCVGCANGTDAIILAAKALQLPEGTEAIVPAMTYFASVSALLHARLKVRLVDVVEETALLNLDEVEKSIGPDTRLLVPVHLYGQMPDMERLRVIADKHQCQILEDASQAHGARWKDTPVGALSDIATFSFYPGKNLGAFGDAGAILTRNQTWAQRCRALGNQGGLQKYQHDCLGYNSRLDELQAVVLSVKLRFVDEWTEKRRTLADQYRRMLAGIPSLGLPVEDPSAKSVYHLFVIRVEQREKIRKFLSDKGVETGVHYPKAIHQLPALRGMFAGQRFPIAERLAEQGVSLPLCPTLTPDDIEYVCDVIREYAEYR